MDIIGVDPRDTGWEVDHPRYRVYFWTPPADENSSHDSDEYEVRGAEIDAVLAWASDKAETDGTTFAVYVLHQDSDGLGLIRLLGTDPNSLNGHEVQLFFEG